MNALHRPANLQMRTALDNFAADPELWIGIITGAGPRAFCAGNDLKYQAAGGDTTKVPCGFGGIAGRFGLNKPVIAPVNGIAMGAGFEIALACDLIIASENAVFALPEPRVGLAALGGRDRGTLAHVGARVQGGRPSRARYGAGGGLPHATRLPAVKAMIASEDSIEGPRAFSEKRPPQWKGR